MSTVNPWPPAAANDQLSAYLTLAQKSRRQLAEDIGVYKRLFEQMGRLRPKELPKKKEEKQRKGKKKKPKNLPKGLRPPRDRRFKLPVNRIEAIIKALEIPVNSPQAHQFRVAALLDHSPPELVEALTKAYPVLAR